MPLAATFFPLVLFLAEPAAIESRSIVLFDFEQGVTPWHGNPWGGGRCRAEPAPEGKYGRALRACYDEVLKGANLIGPNLPPDAPWRKSRWAALRFWLKGDGSTARVSVHVDAPEPGSTGFSVQVPLENNRWHPVEIACPQFWSREGLRLDLSRMVRLMFGCRGTHQFEIDQISLQAPHHEVPLDESKWSPAASKPPVAFELNLYGDGRLGVLCDAAAVTDSSEIRARLVDARGERHETRSPLAPEIARGGELLLMLPGVPQNPGQGTFSLSVLAGDRVQGAHSARVEILGPPRPQVKPFIALLPAPKSIQAGRGELVLPPSAVVRAIGLSPEDRGRCVGFLSGQLREYYGISLREQEGAPAVVVMACAANSAELPPGLLPGDLGPRFDGLADQGYVLRVTPEQTIVAARSARGVFYGIQTLLQAIARRTDVPIQPRAPALTVVDWPSLPVRAASIPLPGGRWGHPNDARVSPEFFCDFLLRTLVRWKYNTAVLIINEGMQFRSHPECSGPAAWNQDEMRRVVDFCRRHYLEPVPLQTVLAHANWFTLRHKELWEDGDYHIACVSNPATQKLLREVYGEILDVFRPRYGHIGMDEAWWRTLDTPPENHCPLCAGKPKSQIVAGQAACFRQELARRGVRAMMWGDMLLEEHNGGPPYHSAKALEALPRDVIICNWSTSLAPLSSKRFRDAGHEVIQSNSWGVNRQQAQWLVGNMAGLWNKSPWLSDSGARKSQQYSYLALISAAEFSWNVLEDLSREIPQAGAELIRSHAEAIHRDLALRGEPAAAGPQQPLSLGPACNTTVAAAGDPPARLAGVEFRLLPRGGKNAVDPSAGPVSIPVGRRVASLYFLHGCRLEEKDHEGFLKRFREKDAIRGIRLGTYRIRFADQTEDSLELRYGWNVLACRATGDDLPYCYAAPAVWLPARLYVAQWANPHPEKPVAAIEFSAAGTEALPYLLAVTAKLPRSTE